MKRFVKQMTKNKASVPIALLVILSSALILAPTAQAQKPQRERPPRLKSIDERIENLTEQLELTEDQVSEMRSIIKGSHELAELDRGRLNGNYFDLALANRERVARDAARIEALMTEVQWVEYQEIKEKSLERKIDRDTETLFQRLNLSAQQKLMFLDITAISRREMQSARKAMKSDPESGGGGGGFGGGRGGGGRGGSPPPAMLVMQAIQKKADKAIEKTLSDEQKKEYKKYKKERDKKKQGERKGGRSGMKGGRGGGGGKGSGGGRGGW